jgi:hypothetical protein
MAGLNKPPADRIAQVWLLDPYITPAFADGGSEPA